MTLVRRLLNGLGSFGLACLLLLDLFLLTWFGTLYQVEHGLHEAQKLYFESWFVVQSSPVPLVLPGGLLCMGLLALNLFVGGMVRIQKSKRTVGVMVVHLGIALMLASGFVKLNHSDDGHLTLYEGEASNEFQSYFLWEVALWDASQKGPVEEHLIPHEQLIDLTEGKRRSFTSSTLPFELELAGFLRNCQPMPKGPMWEAESPVVAGYALEQGSEDKEAERNLAGLTLRARDRATGALHEDLLWSVERHPATFESGGKTWAVSLRHTRYPMPFTIRLEDFRKEDHPGMSMARSFESDVFKIEDGREQKVRIQMNEPLRDGGLVLFQSSWGPSNAGPKDALFSTFSVVRNPSDHWPLYSCIVIGIGLLLAFVPKLLKFVRAQDSARAKLETSA
ncbi:MAG: hypothetical protein HOP15_09520 [Planctomycetes bacterium]|nr:hypothetical protein [Planctomycetota bacterium]